MQEFEIVHVNYQGIKVVGTVPCDTPYSPLDDIDGEDLERWVTNGSKEAYSLRLIGTSMVGYGLTPGMVVVVDCSGKTSLHVGDIVLARLDGCNYTLKKWEPPYLVGDNGRERIEIPIEPSRQLEIVGIAITFLGKLR